MAVWMRAACAVADGSRGQILRFGDNMREVAVTEGDKVSAQIVFGWSVNGWCVGELARGVQQVSEADVKALLDEYRETYLMPQEPSSLEAIREQAKMELVIRRFLEEHQGIGFTTTFEDLHGLKQLPGLTVQRLMAAGYGFGAEGDWKTAALVRAVKVMASGLPGETSFMEDYTYHMEKGSRTGNPYAGDLFYHRRGKTEDRGASPFHRGKGRSRTVSVRWTERTCCKWFVDRFGEPVPAADQSCGIPPYLPENAQTSRSPCAVEAQTRFP